MTATAVGDFSYPAKHWATVVPSDSAVLPKVARALWVGTGGDVAVVDEDGTSATFKNIASGSLVPIRPVQVKSTGTTAADIVALY